MLPSEQPDRLKFLSIFILTMGFLGCLRHIFDIKIPDYSENVKAEITSRLLPTEEPVLVSSERMSSDLSSIDSTSSTNSEPLHVAVDSQPELCPPISATSSPSQVMVESAVSDSINRNTALFRMSGKIWSYDECLPDTQEQHLASAMEYGVSPLPDKAAIERLARNHQLVNISHSPLYAIDKLTYSSPYLVPRARDLLNTISINFMDSLHSKGYPLYLPIVSSVLRTMSDVDKLRYRNRNATENSCHNYGTTFDITYSRYMPLSGVPTPVDSAEWRSSELKLTLAEVLYDLRSAGRCYVKHEHKQPCFHITVR